MSIFEKTSDYHFYNFQNSPSKNVCIHSICVVMATGSPIRVQHSDQIASGHLYDGFAVYSYLTASDIPFEVA